MKKSESRQTLGKVLRYIGAYRFLLLLSMLLAAGTVILSLYIPILFGDAIDGMIGAGQVDWDGITALLVKTGVLAALCALMQWVMNTVNNRITYHVVRDIRNEAFEKIQHLPLSYLDAHSGGDLVSRVIADVDQLADGLLMGFTQLFSGIVTILVTLLFMLSRSVSITVLVTVLTPMSFLVARFIATRTYSMFRLQSTSRGQQTALIEELIGNQKVVRAFGYEQRGQARFDEINDELEKYSLRAVFFSSLTNPATRFVNSVIYALVALAGAWQVIHGALTVGGLSSLLSYANQYTKPFNDISSVVTELQNALACAARIFELIGQEPEIPEKPGLLVLAGEHVQGEVALKDVCFSYDKEKKLIEHLTLTARPGMRIAIVGPTGCGKTTLINLLMRFYDADQGGIFVDGTSIYDVRRDSLRSQYGMVLQETWLKNGTIRENINIGKPDASDEEIIAAAKQAHSWSFIRRLPQQLDTPVSDESLSQGQKQLLCITRVMLAQPPMLILDEATSSIDTRTEVRIQQAFARLMEGRTSFIVAHRLSTIQNADCILVMKDGKIIEQGDHQTLLGKGGFYSVLYHSQFET